MLAQPVVSSTALLRKLYRQLCLPCNLDFATNKSSDLTPRRIVIVVAEAGVYI